MELLREETGAMPMRLDADHVVVRSAISLISQLSLISGTAVGRPFAMEMLVEVIGVTRTQ